MTTYSTPTTTTLSDEKPPNAPLTSSMPHTKSNAIAERKATSALMRVSISEANIPPTIASVSHDCQVKDSIPIKYNTAAKLPLFLRKTHHLQLKINRPNQQNN